MINSNLGMESTGVSDNMSLTLNTQKPSSDFNP